MIKRLKAKNNKQKYVGLTQEERELLVDKIVKIEALEKRVEKLEKQIKK